jgi:protein CpxP
MNIQRWTRCGLGAAALALCFLAMNSYQAHAQDTPPAQDSTQGPPPRDGGPGGRGRMDDRRIERMTKEVSLTPAQVTSIRAVEAESRAQSMALRQDTSVPQDQKREKMMAIRDAAQVKVRALLDDTQKVKFDAMEARMRERMRNGRGPGAGGADGTPPPPPPQ